MVNSRAALTVSERGLCSRRLAPSCYDLRGCHVLMFDHVVLLDFRLSCRRLFLFLSVFLGDLEGGSKDSLRRCPSSGNGRILSTDNSRLSGL